MKKAPVFTRTLPTRYKIIRKKIITFIDRRPLLFFFTLLGILLLLIIGNSLLQRPKVEKKEEEQRIKTVDVYQIGTAPKITVQAVTKKSGVIQIVALTSGIIDTIYHKEGDAVSHGEKLLGMVTTYQGKNALSLQRQIAQTQYNSIFETYTLQKEILEKQKELAEKTDDNSDALRNITEQSIGETQSLISLNEDILKTLDENLKTLEQNPVTNKDLILATKQLKSQFLSATNQARSGLRTSQYQANDNNPQSTLGRVQKEITINQLDVQQKQLDLNREISRLQFLVAKVNEELMVPVAPFRGTIQRVFVKEKQQVNPGAPLMVLSQVAEEDPITAVAFVSKDIADRVSRFESSVLHFGSTTFATLPTFVSTEAVEGTLYAIYYPIPDNFNRNVVSEGIITVEIPIGYPDTGTTIPFVPLDALYITQDKAYVFVIEKGVTRSRVITFGLVYGRFAEITQGLKTGDQIILDRTIIEGDLVTTSR